LADYYDYSIYAVNCPGWSPIVTSPAKKQRGKPLWATQIGGAGFETLTNQAIATDISNNVYIVGQYSTITTGINIYNYTSAPTNGGEIPLTLYGTMSNPSATSAETFIVKYNSSGTAQWVSRVGFAQSQEIPVVATDLSGNVFISGRNDTTYVRFYTAGTPDATSTISLSTAGNMSTISGTDDIYLAKYNSSGIFQWATVIGSTGIEDNPEICTDPFGNVYIAGEYDATITIRNGGTPGGGLNIATTTYATMGKPGSGTGNNDIFLVKYNPSGAALWATRISGIGHETGVSIASDISGNVYVANQYTSSSMAIYNTNTPSGGSVSTILYGNLGFTGTVLTQPDISLVKYNSSGSVLWATRASSSANSDLTPYIATDSSANVYLTGQYGSPTVFTLYNGATAVGTTITPTTYATMPNTTGTIQAEVFLVKYNPSGSAQWATRIGSSGAETIPVITTDSSNNVYIAGLCTSETDVYNKSDPVSGVITPSFYGTLSNTTSATGTDIFLAKYDTNGNAQWGTMIGGTNREFQPSICTDSLGNVFVSGHYSTNALRINQTTLAPSINNSTIGLSLYGTLPIDSNIDSFLIKFQS
jgi:hypothetical protein